MAFIIDIGISLLFITEGFFNKFHILTKELWYAVLSLALLVAITAITSIRKVIPSVIERWVKKLFKYDVDRAAENGVVIDKKLNIIRNVIDAANVNVSIFHNGIEGFYGYIFNMYSIVDEAIRVDSDSIRENHQNKHLIPFFGNILEFKKSPFVYIGSNWDSNSNSTIKQMIKKHNLSGVYLFPIYASSGVVNQWMYQLFGSRRTMGMLMILMDSSSKMDDERMKDVRYNIDQIQELLQS